MRAFTRAALIGITLYTLIAAAQWGPPRGRDRGGRGDYAIGLTSRVMDHLERARSFRRVDDHERRHFEQARYDLERFQVNWRRGSFDKDRIDGAIEHLSDLAQARQVHPQDRRIFARDRDDLRQLRRDWNDGRLRR